MKVRGRMARPVPLSIILALFLAPSAHPNSLGEHQLADVSRVCIDLIVPRLEPIPGSSPDELERRLRERAEAILAQYEVQPAADLDTLPRVLIEVQFAKGRNAPGSGAILVLVEMRELAVLPRDRSHQPLYVSSWRQVQLELLDGRPVATIVSETMDLVLNEFGEAVAAARAVAERRH